MGGMGSCLGPSKMGTTASVRSGGFGKGSTPVILGQNQAGKFVVHHLRLTGIFLLASRISSVNLMPWIISKHAPKCSGEI